MGSTPLGISGSRAAAILGLSEYQTPLETWQQLMEERCPGFNASRGYTLPERPPDPELPARVRWGWAAEDAIVAVAQERAGRPIGAREWLYVLGDPASPYHVGVPDARGRDPLVTCHIDGLYEAEAGHNPVLHEGKTTTQMAMWDQWGEPGTDRVPQAYQVQCQHNMMLTGADTAVITVLAWPRRPEEWEGAGIELTRRLGRSDDPEWHVRPPHRIAAIPLSSWVRALDEMGYLHQYTIEARPSLQAALLSRYRVWWADHVVGEREPEPQTYDDIKRLCPQPKGTVVADEQAQRWATEYREIGEEIGSSGRLAKRREELKVLLLSWMRGHDAAMDDESREKTVLRDSTGRKLAQWNGKVFRT